MARTKTINYPFWNPRYENVHVEVEKRLIRSDWKCLVQRFANTLKSRFKGRDRLIVLDIGCGDGTTAATLLPLIEIPVVYHGIEPDAKTIRVCKRNLNPVDCVIGSQFSTCTFGDFGEFKDSYDLVLFFHSNYYIAENLCKYKAMLQMSLEGLRSEGVVAIITLPDFSPFYRLGPGNVFPDFATAETTHRLLLQLDLCVTSYQNRVRFLFDEHEIPEKESHRFAQYLANDPTLSESESRIIRDRLGSAARLSRGEIDFCDWTLIAQLDRHFESHDSV
ncbi:class I SAM-dependent methyltransferase [Puniceicoccaceae bacterium K14]|nr:class I SAM-dependent methyltransferase [Puniceicoccaceae bacterium K14]